MLEILRVKRSTTLKENMFEIFVVTIFLFGCVEFIILLAKLIWIICDGRL